MAKFELPRLGRLLNMEYTPRELSEELACSVRQIRGALDQGAPHRKTDRGHIFVNGAAFGKWVRERQARPQQRLKPGEAYCLKCRSAVPLTVLETTPTNGNTEIAKGVCPQCGNRINRARRREQ